jgi:replicative DNA helicase
VEADERPVLYLASDRPAQAQRAFARLAKPEWRETLAERLLVWRGPPPRDLAANPEMLQQMAQQAGAGTVVLDSLKDMTVGIAKDEVGAGLNRAIQNTLVEGVEVLGLHHQRKERPDGSKPRAIDDVYGSVWIPAGAGSVLLLWGKPGDVFVELSHLKQPAEAVGPFQLVHDHEAGTSQRMGAKSVEGVLRHSSSPLTTRQVAEAVFGNGDRTAKERARRRLAQLAKPGGQVVRQTSLGEGGEGDLWAWQR